MHIARCSGARCSGLLPNITSRELYEIPLWRDYHPAKTPGRLNMNVELIDKLNRKTAKVGIVGLGYVGLPLMLRYCEVGYKVLGFDIDPTKVDALKAGRSYIEHISAER